MARIFAQNVAEMAIEHTYGGREAVNVLHFVNDEGALSDEAKARDVLNNWQEHIMALLDSQVTLTGARWRSLDPDDTNQGELAPDPAKQVTGLFNGTGLPANSALLVKKVTNNRQRGQRDGRMFLVGVAAQVAETGLLQTAYLNQIQTALDTFLDDVNDDAFGVGGGSGLVVLNTTPASRLPGGPPQTLSYRTVSALLIDPRIASQRDRLR